MGGTGRLYLGSRGSARSNERICSKVRSQRLLKERSCEHQWGWHNLPWFRKPLECRAGEHIQSCKDTKDLCFKAFYLSGLIQAFWVFSYLLILMFGLLFCSVIKKKCFRDWRSSGMLASQKVWSSFNSNLLPGQVPSQHSMGNWRTGYVSPVSRLNSLSRFMSAQRSWDNLKIWKFKKLENNVSCFKRAQWTWGSVHVGFVVWTESVSALFNVILMVARTVLNFQRFFRQSQ